VEPVAEDAHRSDSYLQVVESFGVPVKDRRAMLSVSVDAQESSTKKLKEKGILESDPFLVINPGGNWDLKQWPRMNFTKLIKKIQQEELPQVIIGGAAKDVKLAREIIAPLKNKPLILAGQTSIKEIIAIMQKAVLVISGDSGPLHMANGVGTKTIGIFGPTSPKITGPRGCGHATILKQDVGCNRLPCYFLECPDNVCMKAVSVDAVFREVLRLCHFKSLTN